MTSPSTGSEFYSLPMAAEIVGGRVNTLPLVARKEMVASPVCAGWWFQGVELRSPEVPRLALLRKYPSAGDNPEVAAKDLGRSAGLARILWYPEDDYPSDPRARPSLLIVKPDKVGTVRDWPNPGHGFNGASVNPGVDYGTTDKFLLSLRPSALMAGFDLQNSFLRRLFSSASRGISGVWRPVSGRIGVYLFLPVGLGEEGWI